MKLCVSAFLSIAVLTLTCSAQSPHNNRRDEAEYYARAYAQHYHVPVAFVRAVVQQESSWHLCAVSPKGAKGLMQLMPQTAARLGVKDSCNANQNVSGGVRLLAWLIQEFHGDLRLVAAAYYAGENRVARRGLNYRNPDVVAYVTRLRQLYSQGKLAAVNSDDEQISTFVSSSTEDLHGSFRIRR
jgi:soluble lytic murein transglycosylase-like protein